MIKLSPFSYLPRWTPGVPAIEPPPVEASVALPRGGRLGYAEYGDAHGPLVLWFHGTPGARRQIPPVARAAARDLGLRLVCVERPGIGDSSPHAYGRFSEWAPDMAALADHLGHDRFGVVGLSGGGPYALATAAGLPDRVVAVGILGGVCPVVGADAVDGQHGPIALAKRWRSVLEPIRGPFGIAMWALLNTITPLAHPGYTAFSRLMTPGDQAVFADPGIEAMFIDDLLSAAHRQFGALAHDIALFGRHWGFSLADVRQPVHWWHGDADNFVDLAHARQSVERLPDCTLSVRPGESHLGGFAVADDVLAELAGLLSGDGVRG